jgi:hypothetical protein
MQPACLSDLSPIDYVWTKSTILDFKSNLKKLTFRPTALVVLFYFKIYFIQIVCTVITI